MTVPPRSTSKVCSTPGAVGSSLAMPPPLPDAALPLMVTPATVSVPVFRIPPPSPGALPPVTVTPRSSTGPADTVITGPPPEITVAPAPAPDTLSALAMTMPPA